jgi:CheY-like chemotaxis protein
MTTTRQYGGSGLGLSISKSYIELLGGQISVKSKVDEGSEFHFKLPFTASETPEKRTVSTVFSSELTPKIPKTLLIAEDEDYNFMYLFEILSGENIDIIRTSNGAETVKRCRENTKIDLILMDIKMPIMDGYQATKLIKAFRPELPIIAQTAYAQQADSIKAIESGCSDYISKPINRELLIKKINRHLGIQN